ncbi:hypothetical protein NC653_012263 [Populus alba x Populus x berolinensis]|uniref:Uncharacterized protein n=1 Tax=Populus alba x Populus x berolinensis TaxID=444605 RepID=A0AAD6R5F2_9ROSI|nr:hypothetical protein NC653_012263 [Populus alba x Populus x berolinensis]
MDEIFGCKQRFLLTAARRTSGVVVVTTVSAVDNEVVATATQTTLWEASCVEFPGLSYLIKKLSDLAKHLRLWNCEHFGNQESRQLTLTNKIAELENKQAESIVIVDESSISMLNSYAHIIISLQ